MFLDDMPQLVGALQSALPGDGIYLMVVIQQMHRFFHAQLFQVFINGDACIPLS